MTRAIGWLCFRIVMAWPLPLPDCRENRAFAWILARAGEYADPMMPNRRAVRRAQHVRTSAGLGAEMRNEDDTTE